MAFTFTSGNQTTDRDIVTLNIGGNSYWNLGAFQYVYNPGTDSVVTENELKSIVSTINV